MKRPTITKQQAIAALVELRRRDYNEKWDEWRERRDQLEAVFHDELRAMLLDPVRMAPLLVAGAADDDEHIGTSLEIQAGKKKVTIDFSSDAVVAKACAEFNDCNPPKMINESELTTKLEDKLTGCDPQSLLSVPENVATMRALLNGLQLMPESYDSLTEL